MLRAPFYDALRTQQQLGYIVNAGTLPMLKTNGLVLVIESPVADPLELEARIDEFLQQYSVRLSATSASTFAEIKAGLVNSVRQPAQRLNELSNRYWSDILTEDYDQDSALLMADALDALPFRI